MTEDKFRFGVVGGWARDLESWVDLARRAEQLGFDTLLATDPVGTHDPMTLVPAALAATSTLHVGTFVLADPLRDRHALTWQALTLHALSGGRFELGLGTGRPDVAERAAAMGREFGSASRRVERLGHTISELPAQRPRLLLAAGGPKMLSLAASRADTVTLAWSPRTTEDQAQQLVDRFTALAGERITEIELAANLVAVGDEPAPWLAKLTGVDAAQLAAEGAVTVLPGTPAHGADTLRRWRERLGISYFTINSGFLEQFAPIVEELSGCS